MPMMGKAPEPLPVGQAFPQVPQFLASLERSTQGSVGPQLVQMAAHFPITQAAPAPQAVPQAPQFAGSLEKSTQAVLPLQVLQVRQLPL